jgi:hypothetical protein
MSRESLIGKTGRVSGTVGPGTVGEIVVAIRGGHECYFAHPADGASTFHTGARVIVTEDAPGRTVYVEALQI